MGRLLAVGLALLSSLSGLAQNADDSLRTQLEGLHAKWFTAFRSADIATMNQMETNNIVLVMPDGYVIQDFSPRKNGDLKADPAVKDTLSRVTVRRFGDTAVLVGILTSESPKETSRAAETVIFVLNSGQWKISSAQWTSVATKK
jgi:ketosteroid isomerase-like protein